MRKLIYSFSVSLDGDIEDADGDFEWAAPDAELHGFFNEHARRDGGWLYRRRLYELMSAHWPTADDDPAAEPVVVDFARIWRDKPKTVFSTTLERVDWNSRLVRTNVADEVRALKAEDGGPLAVGGAGLAGSLARLGLIDEYHLLVHPVAVGGGKPYFPLGVRLDLALAETRTFGTGVVYLRYTTRVP